MSTSRELIEKWYEDNTNRPQLEALLSNPIMQRALKILYVSASEPIPIPYPGVDMIDYGAAMGYTRNGGFNILKALEDLSRPKPRPPTEAPAFNKQAQEQLINKAKPPV